MVLPLKNLSLLVKQKTVTISNLMPHMPEGTINPSTTLYNTTMFAMAGFCNSFYFKSTYWTRLIKNIT